MSSQPPPPPQPSPQPPATPPAAIVRPRIPFTPRVPVASAVPAVHAPSSLSSLPAASSTDPFRDVSCLGLSCQAGVAGLALGALGSLLPFHGPHPRPLGLLSMQGMYMSVAFAGAQCTLSKHRPMSEHAHMYTAVSGVTAAAAAGAVEAAYVRLAARLGWPCNFPRSTALHTAQLAAFLGVAGAVYEALGLGETKERTDKRKSG